LRDRGAAVGAGGTSIMTPWTWLRRRYHQLKAQDHFVYYKAAAEAIPVMDSYDPRLTDAYLLHRHIRDYAPSKVIVSGHGFWERVIADAMKRWNPDGKLIVRDSTDTWDADLWVEEATRRIALRASWHEVSDPSFNVTVFDSNRLTTRATQALFK
jgi:hypothetical protein